MNPLTGSFDFKKLVQNSLDLMGSMDRDGYIHYVNEACTRISGYESEELVGRRYADFIHPDDLLHTSKIIQAVIQGQQEGLLENRNIHKKGLVIPIMWSFIWSADDGYLYFTGRDIRAQKIAESRIEESETRYRALFESSPDILFVENKQGLITQINRHFSQAFAVSTAQIVGTPAASVLSAEAAALNESNLQQA
jgi:PAS domain S-box-containing protein